MKDKNIKNNNWPFNKMNYLLFSIGISTVFSGYLIMVFGEVNSFLSIKIAPVILVIGYLIIIPVSIFYKK